MKIDRTKLKKSSSEVPADCKNLIEKLKVTLEPCSKVTFVNLLILGLQSRSVLTGTEEHRYMDLRYAGLSMF